MRRWWKALGVLAGGLVSLGGVLSSATAQFPPSGPGGYGPPPGMMGGMPGGMPPGMMGGMPGMVPGVPTGGGGGGPPPGAFGGNPNLGGMPAEFPNPRQPSQEPASPFTIKDEGYGGAFTELIDPRPRRPQPYTFALRTEVLSWWITKAPISVDLVTTTTQGRFDPFTDFGALGQANTQILVPGSAGAIDYKSLLGVRTTLGIASGILPPIEVSGFTFNRNFNVFTEGSPDATGRYLARPVQILNIGVLNNIGVESVEPVNIPVGLLAQPTNGTISIMSRLSFWGIDASAFFNIIETERLRVDLLFGYRHADLYESLEINNTSGGNSGQVIFGGVLTPVGFTASVLDVYRTRNAFDGGQVGLRSVLSFGRLSVFTDGKIAMGGTSHMLSIDGNTTLTQPAPNRAQSVLPGGLTALPSGSGIISRNEFSIVSEANISLSFQLAQNLRIFGGYNILYWSSVARPGDHINSVIDVRGVPTSFAFTPGAGTAPRMPPISIRDFWAQGVFAGVEIGF